MSTELAEVEEVEPISKRAHYPEATIMAGLGELVIHHSSVKASKAMKEAGLTVAAETIKSWRQRYPRRFALLSRQHTAALEAVMTGEWKDNALIGTRVAKKALLLEEERIDNREVRDAAKSFQSLSIGSGVSQDKAMLLEGRPAQITEHRRDADDILESLKKLAPGLIVEGSAVELEQGDNGKEG